MNIIQKYVHELGSEVKTAITPQNARKAIGYIPSTLVKCGANTLDYMLERNRRNNEIPDIDAPMHCGEVPSITHLNYCLVSIALHSIAEDLRDGQF